MQKKGEFLETHSILQWDFSGTVKKEKKYKRNKNSQTAKLVYAKLLFVSSVVMRFTHEGSLKT